MRYGQATDRAFAKYLFISKGSALEIRGHLAVALGRKYLAKELHDSLAADSVEIEKMLASLIRYLHRSDWKYRG